MDSDFVLNGIKHIYSSNRVNILSLFTSTNILRLRDFFRNEFEGY